MCPALVAAEVEGVGLACLELHPYQVPCCDRLQFQGCRNPRDSQCKADGMSYRSTSGSASYLGDRFRQGGGEGEAESATPPSPSPL